MIHKTLKITNNTHTHSANTFFVVANFISELREQPLHLITGLLGSTYPTTVQCELWVAHYYL